MAVFIKKTVDKKMSKSEEIANHIATLPDGIYKIEIKKLGSRSNQQNAYLRGVVYEIIADNSGHTVDEVHNLFKIKFLSEGLTIGSTSELNKSEFGEYIENIRAFVADFGLVIPDPVESPEKNLLTFL